MLNANGSDLCVFQIGSIFSVSLHLHYFSSLSHRPHEQLLKRPAGKGTKAGRVRALGKCRCWAAGCGAAPAARLHALRCVQAWEALTQKQLHLPLQQGDLLGEVTNPLAQLRGHRFWFPALSSFTSRSREWQSWEFSSRVIPPDSTRHLLLTGHEGASSHRMDPVARSWAMLRRHLYLPLCMGMHLSK